MNLETSVLYDLTFYFEFYYICFEIKGSIDYSQDVYFIFYFVNASVAFSSDICVKGEEIKDE